MTWYLVSSNFLQLNLAQSVVECVQLTAVEVNGLTSKQESLTPRRTQGGSSWGYALGRRVSWYGGEKRDSEEKGLLNMVTSGGV